MPSLLSWFGMSPTASGSSATNTAVVTSGLGGQPVYVTIADPRHTHALSQTAEIYGYAPVSTTTWTGVQTMTTSSTGNAYWIFDASQDQWLVMEEVVDHGRYVRLAQQRCLRTEQELAAIAQAQEAHRRQMQEEHARYLREEAQRDEQRKAAYARSRELLLSHLTPAQRRTFEQNQWFIVQGGASKKKYRIRTTGYTGNIEEMQGNSVTHRLCGHINVAYALHDHHVAQKISLEWDEENFVRICNRHRA